MEGHRSVPPISLPVDIYLHYISPQSPCIPSVCAVGVPVIVLLFVPFFSLNLSLDSLLKKKKKKSKHLMGSISNSSVSFPEREAESIYPEVHEVWG